MNRRNAIPPIVSASLIHEFRMIATQFFRSRENMNFWQTRTTPKAAPALRCVFCLSVTPKKAADAITIKNGQAICADHKDFADTEFAVGLRSLMADNLTKIKN